MQSGFEVQTGCTAQALKFIGPSTLEGLTGRPVFSDVYEAGRQMDHINLAKWADLAIVCPASANTINSLGQGLASDAIGALFLAFDLKKPFLVAPAMNVQMLSHPATQGAISKLRSLGVQVLDTESGSLACGDNGEGRLLNPDLIFAEIQKQLARFV